MYNIAITYISAFIKNDVIRGFVFHDLISSITSRHTALAYYFFSLWIHLQFSNGPDFFLIVDLYKSFYVLYLIWIMSSQVRIADNFQYDKNYF